MTTENKPQIKRKNKAGKRLLVIIILLGLVAGAFFLNQARVRSENEQALADLETVPYARETLTSTISGAGTTVTHTGVGNTQTPRTLRLTGKNVRVVAPAVINLNGRGYNDGITPLRTQRDWLSRVPEVPDDFIADPWCGVVPSAAFLHDITVGLRHINDPEGLRLVPDGLPVLVISGEADPVGERGAGPRTVVAQYRAAGLRDVTLRLYPEGRHEPLNDLDAAGVRDDVLTWAEGRVGGGE